MKSFRQFIAEEDDFKATHFGYHGSPDARDILKNGFKSRKQQYDEKDDKPVFWAAKDYRVAASYADDTRAFDYQNSEPKTMAVELQMKNPKHIHWNGMKFHDKDADGNWHHIDKHIEQAREDGHDGFVIHRVVDTYHAKGKPSTIMGVFDSKNIRLKK